MNTTELTFGIVFLFQMGTGLSGNIFLLLFYARMAFASPKLSPSDLGLAHLALANTIILLTFGIPETMSAWGWRNFLDSAGCKFIMYLFRVARSLAICSTCLLSMFQAITISPGTPRWAWIKARLPRCVVPSCLSWGHSLLVDSDVLVNMTGPQNRSVQLMLDFKYCSKISASAEIILLITFVRSFRDVFFVVLMSAASGYMVFVLHRHHQQVRHLHTPGRSPRVMPEVRAAKRVVALATLYILLYGRQTIMFSVLLNMREKSFLLVTSHMVLGFTFSAVSPLLMIHSDRRIRRFWKKESPDARVSHS
ncbi:vomeronasal 1 receptor ornAnaV1R3155 [Ornithorhynchus anatinus]|uniref:vomeronasal 1 receptor ornAnaV1R3155 n=1 Tax=Ornithorhynchus anatinus TaxID=9258 RepID=UPI00023AC9E0|nr:vomeronasal 1 receptor ornAnaV1R3155 [Ornithorhynchus anatinus]